MFSRLIRFSLPDSTICRFNISSDSSTCNLSYLLVLQHPLLRGADSVGRRVRCSELQFLTVCLHIVRSRVSIAAGDRERFFEISSVTFRKITLLALKGPRMETMVWVVPVDAI